MPRFARCLFTVCSDVCCGTVRRQTHTALVELGHRGLNVEEHQSHWGSVAL